MGSPRPVEVQMVASAGKHPTDPWVEIGRVRRPHGLGGALLIALYGDDPSNLRAVEEVYLEGRDGGACMKVTSIGSGAADRIRVELEGVEGREGAERWKGAKVCIRESQIQPLPEGEFYWREVLGLECHYPDGRPLGTLKEIWTTGSNDVLVLESDGEQLLIPALRGVIQRLDREHGRLILNPPPVEEA